MNKEKILTIKRVAQSTIFRSGFERLSIIEYTWQTYHKDIEMNYIGTAIKTFTVFFYFLSGFLRNILRYSYKFKLHDYMINLDFFSLYVGQTHCVNTGSLVQINKLIYGKHFENILINPLLYVRIGCHYFDRITLLEYLEDISKLFENQKILSALLQNSLMLIQNYYIYLQTLLTTYYQSITFIL